MSDLGPRAELLATGTLGPAGVDLLYRTARQAVRLRRVPPPEGAPAWSTDALMEVAHDVLAARDGPARVALLAARSADERTFRSQLLTLVLNDLATAGRRTERGRLSERVKDVVAKMSDVHTDVGRYLADSSASAPATFEDLVQVAARVPVVVPEWSEHARHHGPVADRASLEALVRAVLGRAPGGLTHSELVAVLARRLGVHDRPIDTDVELLETLAGPASPAADPVEQTVTRSQAERLLAELTVEQQMVLPYLQDPVREVAAATGLRRTKAWEVAQVTRLRLLTLLDDTPESARVLAEATERARARWSAT